MTFLKSSLQKVKGRHSLFALKSVPLSRVQEKGEFKTRSVSNKTCLLQIQTGVGSAFIIAPKPKFLCPIRIIMSAFVLDDSQIANSSQVANAAFVTTNNTSWKR